MFIRFLFIGGIATKTGGIQCDRGYYCPVGSPDQIACPPGKYCSDVGQEIWAGDCQAGYYCSGAAISSQSENCPKVCFLNVVMYVCDKNYFRDIIARKEF